MPDTRSPSGSASSCSSNPSCPRTTSTRIRRFGRRCSTHCGTPAGTTTRCSSAREDGLVVGYLETDDFAAATARMATTAVNEKWQAGMAKYFDAAEAGTPTSRCGRSPSTSTWRDRTPRPIE